MYINIYYETVQQCTRLFMSEIAVLRELQEGKFYNIQLTVCEDTKSLNVINGKVRKEVQYTFEEEVGYDSDTELIEVYKYIFFIKNNAVGTLVFNKNDNNMYLKYNDGRKVRVGCSINISGQISEQKAFLF